MILVIALVLTSVIGLFYYLRVIITLYSVPTTATGESVAVRETPLAAGAVLFALTVLLIWLGVYPVPLMRLIEATVASLS